MKKYIVKPNGATDPMDLFLVEVSGDYISTTAKVYARGSYPFADDYTIECPVLREDFSNNETLEVYKKWDGCTEVSMNEHFCGTGGGAQFDQLALMMKAAAFLCDQMIAEDEAESAGITFEEALQRNNCDEGADENPGITFEEYSALDEARAEIAREKYTHHIEGPIMNEAAMQLANRFDDIVMGVTTAGPSPFDFMNATILSKPQQPMQVILDEPHEWARSVAFAQSYVDKPENWGIVASTADTILPKKSDKDKRKAQKKARKQNRKK